VVEHFRVLGVDLRVEGPADVVGSIGAAYARFKIPANSGAPQHRVTVPSDTSDAQMLLYQRFLATVLLHVEHHAVFHGAALVDRIEGDFFSVMGLPVRLVLQLLEQAGHTYRFGSE